ncbi:histidinol-phosphate transaminase [Undibacterium sp.]|uniref:histidinol-phosphate transaminase n=1 Tax=Undibacterium sp. TaxID=1914977 RepID=UPI00374D33C5
MINLPTHIQNTMPYQAGKPIAELARETGIEESAIIKLASNENPLGMSPRAKELAMKALDDVSRYPDAHGFSLKLELSKRFSVPDQWITLGNGSNDILEMVASTFLQPGSAAVFSQYAFIVYAQATQRVGAKAIVVPAKEYGNDLQAMLAAVTSDTRLIFIANPNNPTGTFLPAADIECFLASVPAHVVVVLDEAYNEYLPQKLRFDSVEWVRKYSNLIVSRTLSKAYGLAGLRVGYAIAQPQITDYMNRIRQAFNVSNVAQAAAIGALQDGEFLQRTYECNREGLQQLVRSVCALGIEYVPSYANFLLIRVPQANAVYQALLSQGIIVRPVGVYGLAEWLRISVGTAAENEAFAQALKKALHTVDGNKNA